MTAKPYPTAAELRAEPLTRLVHDAPIQQAVDDYLLMERKARAWDEAVRTAGHEGLTWYDLDRILRDVHPAQPSAPADR